VRKGDRVAIRVAVLARELNGVQFTAALDGDDLTPFTDLLAEAPSLASW
jgi:hypothetical protein